jgi:ribosome maturation factor RimP
LSLEKVVEPAVTGLGYELVDLQASNGGRMLRLFIDKPGGITVGDCAAVSRHLTRLLAVEGIDYERLEVSSPGLDRPLKRLEDYRRFSGQKASVRLKLPRDGRRRFDGLLAGVEGDAVVLEVEGERKSFAFGDIDRARLVPDV